MNIQLTSTKFLPVTSNNPDVNCFKKTTRLPLNRPANKISTVPGVIVFLSFGGFRTGLGPLV